MIQSLLSRLAEVQIKHAELIVGLGFILTMGLAAGIPNIQLETDFEDSLPDDLDPVQVEDKIESEFRSTSNILIVFELEDETYQEGDVNDMRDPKMLESIQFLEERLSDETIVSNVRSPASIYDEIPDSIEEVDTGETADLYSRDFTAAQMQVSLEEEMTEENINTAEELIRDHIESYPEQPGVESVVSGDPVIRTDIGDALVSDSATTIAIASGLILVLLSATRGLEYGPLTFVPLFGGLIWTLGVMGWLGIPLTIATVSLGAIILGLGVEYGSFITERIIEESEDGSVEDAIRTAIPETGFAVVGSSTTTIVGFSALLVASISFIRNLGLTLSIGIALTVVSALILTPSLLLTIERLKEWKF